MSESGGGVGLVQEINGKYSQIKDANKTIVRKDPEIDLSPKSNQSTEDIFVSKDAVVQEPEKKEEKKSILESIKKLVKSLKKDKPIVLQSESGGGSN